jgi:hypothetical protein
MMYIMKATLLSRFKQSWGAGSIEGVIWQLPEPVPPSEHRIKYRLVYIVDGVRMVGYDNERGKGDHKHIRDRQWTYVFSDVATLMQDFKRDITEIEREYS